MWGKTNDRESEFTTQVRPPVPQQTPAPAPPPPPPAHVPNSAGKTIRLKGEIRSKEELFFDGELEGSIEVHERLTVGPAGPFDATARAAH